MGEPEEFSQKTSVSYGLIAWAVMIAASTGYLYASMHFNDRQAVKNSQENRLYTQQEVDGLRADWERKNKDQEKKDDDQDKRIEALEKYHKE